ncbi:hypothetical protein L1987_21375 [Smallanthus sonchifolius]|uniref:Uncharacterized protein n=1 Tax=Smallanthus sonchifolius TaxID=185202 RepID=A0ACB9IUF0_9ASTR|nr:hypothetical protein L1987_21375 [Smallanthus sonchifolius]
MELHSYLQKFNQSFSEIKTHKKSFLAEIFIGAFISVLFEKLASSDLIRLAGSAGIYSELNISRHTLIQIQAMLVDAGEKHIRAYLFNCG